MVHLYATAGLTLLQYCLDVIGGWLSTCERCAWQQLTTLPTWWRLKTVPRQRRWRRRRNATRRGCRKQVDDARRLYDDRAGQWQWQGTSTKVGLSRQTHGRTDGRTDGWAKAWFPPNATHAT